jgi:hypothetical protein
MSFSGDSRMSETERQKKLVQIAGLSARELQGWVGALRVLPDRPFHGEMVAVLERELVLRAAGRWL